MKEVNYSVEQIETIREAGVIDNALATELAARFGKTVASVRAKAVSLGVYRAQERKTKSGDPIETKDAIVTEITNLVGKNMEGLEKAPKAVLREIRAALAA